MEADVSKLVGSGLCIVANAGAGKTGAIRVLLEETYGQLQQIILDVEDDFYTLRERYDFLIAGGTNGDCPATPANAAALAKMLMENPGISAIIQLNDLKVGQQEEFIRLFLTQVMETPRDQWHPALFVLDEAHRYAPQDGGSSAGEAVHDLTSRGRKRGFTAVLATQRMAKIDKNVTGDINNWMLGRVGQATDRRVAADALGFGPSSAEARSLMTLANRQFYGFGVAMSEAPVKFEVRKALTTMVKAGDAAPPARPAPKAMAAIARAMAKVVADAAKAAEAARTAASASGPHTTGEGPEGGRWLQEAEIDAIRGEAFREGALAETKVAMSNWREMLAELQPMMEEVRERVTNAAAVFNRFAIDTHEADMVLAAGHPVEPASKYPAPVITDDDGFGNSKTVARRRPPPPPTRSDPADFAPEADALAGASAAKVTGPGQRILDALAWWWVFGLKTPTNEQVAFVANYSPTSTGYTNPRSALRSAGLIEYPAPGLVSYTAEGAALAQAPAMAPTVAQMHERIMSKLNGPQQRIMRPLLAAYPKALTNAQVCEQAGYSPTSTGYTNPRSSLKSLSLLEYPVAGEVRAADWLFPNRR
jgi:hypothetical protein